MIHTSNGASHTLRRGTVVALMAIGAGLGSGTAFADGGVSPAIIPAPTPEATYACVAAENAARDLGTANEAKTAAETTAAQDALAATQAEKAVQDAIDRGAPYEEIHALQVDAAVATQTAQASTSAANTATVTRDVANAHFEEVKLCQQMAGGVPLPPGVPVPPVVAVPPVVPAAVPQLPAAVPVVPQAEVAPAVQEAQVAAEVATPPAEVVTGRDPGMLGDMSAFAWRWILLGLGVVAFLYGLVTVVVRGEGSAAAVIEPIREQVRRFFGPRA